MFKATENGGNMKKRSILAMMLLSTALHAQTWYTVTTNNESTGLSATMPAGATYDYGCPTDNLWSAPITVATVTPGVTSWMLGSPKNTLKDTAHPTCAYVLRVMESATVQKVSLLQNGNVAAVISVPALPVVLPTYSITVSGATIPAPTVFPIYTVGGCGAGNSTDLAGNVIFFTVCVQPAH